jgi:hypothetical protein
MADRALGAARTGNAERGGHVHPHRSAPRLGGEPLTRVAWEREMRRLRAGVKVLIAVLVALLARVMVSGVSAALELTGAIIAALLITSLLLIHEGRRISARGRRWGR